MFTSAHLNWRQQALPRNEIRGEQAAEAVIHWLFQVLLATKVTLGRQDGGVPEKELYLLQFTSIDMAELPVGAPKIMRREAIKLQALRSGQSASQEICDQICN